MKSLYLVLAVLLSSSAALAQVGAGPQLPPPPGAEAPPPPGPTLPPPGPTLLPPGQGTPPQPATPWVPPPGQGIPPQPATPWVPPPGQGIPPQPATPWVPPPGSTWPPPGQPMPGPYVPMVPPPVLVQPVIAPPIPSSRWSVSVEALWLERDVGCSIPLGYTFINPKGTGFPALSTDVLQSDDVLFPLATGMRLQISRQISDQAAIEATYWGLQQWSVGRAIYGDPDGQTVLADSPWLQLPGLLGGLDNFLGYTYNSQVDSAEFNERLPLGFYGPYGGFRWLWGFRYFYLADHFTLTGADSSGAYENLDYRTKNNLVGMQAGLQWVRGWERFQVSTEGKIGLLADFYTQAGTDSGGGLPSSFVPWEGSHSGSDLAALFEFSVLARFRITPYLWLRAGYQFYCVTGLALGPRQLAAWDHGGTVGLDGLSLGMEAAW